MSALLEVRGLEAAYGDVPVLWGIDLEVRQGEIVALVGANGAGKTTTLRVIAGTLPPRAGRIVFDGADVTGLPAHRLVAMGVVLVPEGRQLWPRMTVEENLLLGAYARTARADAARRLARVYELFPRLHERRHQLAGTLSGGEQQMCAIGRGLMGSPRLLMMDEPSLGLAPMVVEQIFATVREVAASGVTILLIEQNITHALELAHRAYVLETGRITLSGPGKELLHDDHVRRTYLGLP